MGPLPKAVCMAPCPLSSTPKLEPIAGPAAVDASQGQGGPSSLSADPAAPSIWPPDTCLLHWQLSGPAAPEGHLDKVSKNPRAQASLQDNEIQICSVRVWDRHPGAREEGPGGASPS